MSYATMDHAGWVAQNNASLNVRRKAKDKMFPEQLDDFQTRAFDILGIVFGGIYNAPIAWDRVEYMTAHRGLFVPLNVPKSFATFDFDHLTGFTFLCHEARIRGEIAPHGPRGLRISMHGRSAQGGLARRHPNLDEAVADFRRSLPADHRLFYREPTPLPAAAS